MRNRIFLLVVITAFLFSGARVNAQEGSTNSQIEVLPAEITPVMGYQGRLVEGGVPVTGSRSMTFSLFNVETSGTQIWSETKTLTVSNGLFQTALGDTIPFTEAIRATMTQNLWLQVSVGSTILPRQRLMGSPYAFTLAPGAIIEATQPQYALNVHNDTTDGTGLYARGRDGIYGTATSGNGVMGNSISGHGLVAESSGTGDAGAALWAKANAATGVSLLAQSNSSMYTANIANAGSGLGLSVNGTGGIYATGNSGVGVQGTSTSNYGLWGSSGSKFGVLAQSNGTGLNGSALKAQADGGAGIGLWSYTNSTDSAIVSSNDGTGPLFKAFGGNGGNEEFIVTNNGTVKQALAADGLVKAAAYYTCNFELRTIHRWFNNVAGAVTLEITEYSGCTIDFGFDLSQRFWAVSEFNTEYALGCQINAADHDQLLCDSGSLVMVVIY